MSEEILINGKKITELSDIFFEYCKLKKENEELKEKIHFKNLYKLSGKCFFDEARECHYFDDFVKTKQENKNLKEQVDDLVKDLKVQNGIIGKFEQALEKIRSYCDEQNLKADYTACEVLTIIDEVQNENKERKR